jgi:membrane protease subunit HflK
VTRERLYLDTMQQVFSNTSKVLIDSRGNGNNLLYLPLDRLVQQAAADARPVAAPVAPSADAPSAPTAPSSAGTRDGLRARDRDAGR